MPMYRIHRLKEHLRSSFRYAPHTSGKAAVKPRDYEPAGTIEADSPYAAFFAQRSAGAPLEVGDVLETPAGALTIFKFVGFEDAEWIVPPVKSETDMALESVPDR
jgi:hypothetical protein